MPHANALILTAGSSPAEVRAHCGNKGRYLHALAHVGAPVPPWCALSTRAFARQSSESNLGRRVSEVLRTFSPAHAAEVARTIANEIETTPLVEDVRAAIASAAFMFDGPLAVRSSGAEEDSNSYSFAGQFDSFLGVAPHDVEECVKKCWASAYSARALTYRHQHGLPFDQVEIAVVVQRLVAADVSGVAFSIEPTTGNPFQVAISAVYGLGEGLVSGAVDADLMVLDKHGGGAIQMVTGEKRQAYTPTGVVDVADELRAAPCLSESQQQQIRRMVLDVERAFGTAQDVEWCIANEKLWLVQARPVTTTGPLFTTGLDIWDNSNIIENYPGVTSQLTFSFARHLYGRVFSEYCRLLRIPRKQRQELDEFLPRLLGYAHGRVYYNLLNWYRLVGVNPMQKLGREMMAVQMGLADPLDLEQVAERIVPYHTDSRLGHWCVRAISGLRFFEMFARSDRYIREFCRDFDALYRRYDALAYHEMAPEDVFGHYRRFERDAVELWGVTISLESSIGLPYGLLRKLVKQWIPDAPGWFEVGIIGDVQDVESVQQSNRVHQLARVVRSDPELLNAFSVHASADLYAVVASGSRFPTFAALIEAYIRDFGYRSNNELKLEEPDLREDPTLLFDMIKTCLKSSADEEPVRSSRDYGRRAEEILRTRLNLPQRLLVERVRAVVQQAIRRREAVRLYRTRLFGVFRRMFRALGQGLHAQGLLEDPRDVFQLRREELEGCFDGGICHREIKTLVAMRKENEKAFRAMPHPPPRIVTRGVPSVYLHWQDETRRRETAGSTTDDSPVSLKGTACCPGSVKGLASVVAEPGEFSGGVLVTYRTDPGWIAVFPSAQALLIERGSPLTHAAIVAREMGLPTIVQIPGLTAHVKTGMDLVVDADQGSVALADVGGA